MNRRIKIVYIPKTRKENFIGFLKVFTPLMIVGAISSVVMVKVDLWIGYAVFALGYIFVFVFLEV